ncbi:MAG: glucokinase [Nitrospiria bacterium]
MILAGDIGGTHTRLALFQNEGDVKTPLREATLSSRKYTGLVSAVRFFLEGQTGPIRAACFGVAGPVFEGRCTATNLPWCVDAAELAKALTIPSLKLINDLEAMVLGALVIEEKDLYILNAGAPEVKGNRAVIAAGTGLGEGMLFWDGTQYRSSASEGGHCDFAPRNPLEIELLEFLLTRYQRVSYERLLSGPGLLNLYEFLKNRKESDEPAVLKARLKKEDPSAVITEMALSGESELCVEAIDLFAAIYGAEAGNLALKVLATGGVYIGGGIAPKIVKPLSEGRFMKAYGDKGRFSDLVARIPVHIILNDQCALLGAAHCCLND